MMQAIGMADKCYIPIYIAKISIKMWNQQYKAHAHTYLINIDI